MSKLIELVELDHANQQVPQFVDFRAGDSIRVHCKIIEGNKTRIQEFEGVCIATKARGKMNGHFKIRKLSGGIGVERLFPYHSPNIAKIELLSRGKVNRAKLYYLRDRLGKAARIETDYAKESQEAQKTNN